MSHSRFVAPERQLAKQVINAAKEQGTSGRPVSNPADAVKVSIGLDLFTLLSVDSNDFLSIGAILKLRWKDPVLAWDPAKHSGADVISIPADAIWRPDIVFYNDCHCNASDFTKDLLDANVLVMADGGVLWVPRLTLKTSCTNNGQGILTAKFVAGSWVHDNAKMIIEFDGGKSDVGVEDFQSAASGLELVGHSASLTDKEFASCPGFIYRLINFEIKVKRAK